MTVATHAADRVPSYSRGKRVTRRFWGLLLVGLGLYNALTGFSPAASATATATVQVLFTIAPTQTLTLTAQTVDFGLVRAGTSTAGREVRVIVQSNVNYSLAYEASDFTGSWTSIPVGRLSYDGGRTRFAGSGVLVDQATAAAGAAYTYYYVLITELGDPEGEYVGFVTYILTPR